METLDVRGTPVEIFVKGSGPALLYLHAEQFFDSARVHLDTLARSYKVIAPRHPGFGSLGQPADIRSVDDLAYLYLDLLDQLDLKSVVLVGASFGGWIALEMCVRNVSRVGKLVLVSPVGVKFSGREDRDFADIFYLPDSESFPTLFADPARFAPKYAELPPDQVEAIARERQALAYYSWKPYLHNPGLNRWLHRVDVPTLVVAGESDRFSSPGYARKLSERLPRSQLRLIPGAGHYPQIEQPDALARVISTF